jgi:CubicO group peptidase (beta-lactamase class C family)
LRDERLLPVSAETATPPLRRSRKALHKVSPRRAAPLKPPPKRRPRSPRTAPGTAAGQVLAKGRSVTLARSLSKFLREVVASHPADGEIHVIADSLSARKSQRWQSFWPLFCAAPAAARALRRWGALLYSAAMPNPLCTRAGWKYRPALAIAAVAFALASASSSTAASQPLPRSTPEAQGIPSAAITAFVEAANEKVDVMHSFMLLRHGQVVAESWWKPQAADKPHEMHSLSKSVTSTAVGVAVAEGKLSVDDPVLKFFPEEAPPEPSANLKAMRVRDLLTMSTGHQTEAKFTRETPWVKSFLAQPVPFKPGTHFLYNTSGTHMLSAIIRKVTGETLLDYLRPRLFEPLGIENPEWGSSPQGNTFGGWGLKLRTEDIAKFGQLFLQKGRWEGKQLVSEAWVEQATARQVSNGSDPARDWEQGYGFQFWRCRHGAFRADGAFGQLCVVMPEQDAVLAITADTKDTQGLLNIIWDKILAAFQSAALPENSEEQAKLQQTFANLAVPDSHVQNVLKPRGGSGEHVSP